MMIKGSLLLSATIVKHFRSKKIKSRFGPKFLTFLGINMDLTLLVLNNFFTSCPELNIYFIFDYLTVINK